VKRESLLVHRQGRDGREERNRARVRREKPSGEDYNRRKKNYASGRKNERKNQARWGLGA